MRSVAAIASFSAWTAIASPCRASEGDSLEDRVLLGFTVGYAQLRDDLVRPLRSAGPQFGVGAEYEHRGEALSHHASVALGAGMLDDRFANRTLSLAATASYALSANVLRRPTASLWIGGRARAAVFDQYHADWDDSHLYWLTAYDLGPSAWARVALPLGEVGAELLLPVCAVVGRPPEFRYGKIDRLKSIGNYFAQPNEELELASLDRYRAIASQISWTVFRSEHQLVRVSYGFDYRYASFPREVEILTHAIGIGAGHAF